MKASLLFLLLALTGAADAAAPAKSVAIALTKESFVPATATVPAGAHIVWTNNDSVPHSVTANDGRFDSGPVLPGKTFEWMASGSGDIAYHCIYHPSMTATLKVKSK
jgi:plastocyanin